MGKVLVGKSVNDGIAIGRVHFMGKQHIAIEKEKITDIAAQIERFEQAKQEATDSLNQLQRKAAQEVGEENAQIFQVQAMLLEDMEYQDSVQSIIRTQQTTAEYAVAATGKKFFQELSGLEDAYLRERAEDVRDVSDRVLAILKGENQAEENREKELEAEPVILAAEDLTPSQTVQLDKSRILAFVTQHGSVNSHTAILARTMNIPALTGITCTPDMDGKMAIADGYEGRLCLEPDAETLQDYREQKAQEETKRQRLTALKGKKNITQDGRKIAVYANIGSVSDVAEVLANDAGGIGLFRSEFLYLENNGYPSEEAQFQAYREVAVAMTGKRVVVRTLDIGSDKQAPYFQLPEEQNPAMGYRGIRICLDRPELFKAQLRAAYRASWYGNLSIMFPMIISVEEVRRAKEMIAQVKKELTAEGLPYRECEIGIMIETPAAVMISDLLAKEVDFFSVGTNDLSQYTLAIDRLNPKLDSLYDPHHEAILRMLRMVVENGHKEGCLVSICGELAADVTLTETFLQMGVDALSVPPSMVLPVREKIRTVSLAEYAEPVVKTGDK